MLLSLSAIFFLTIGGAGVAPAFAHATDGPLTVLSNRQVTARWEIVDGTIHPLDLADRMSGRIIVLGKSDFSILLTDGSNIRSNDLKLMQPPRIEALEKHPLSPKLTDRLGGKKLVAALADKDGRFKIVLNAILRDGSRYLREEVSITAQRQDQPVRRIQMIDLDIPGLVVNGTTQGAPMTTSNIFAGTEDPLSRSHVDNGHGASWIERKLPIRAGQTATASSVIGFSEVGQLRRTFLSYVERERAHPYRPFLHYNSWYDIGFGNPFSEKECLDAILAISDQLVKKRNVTISSFLFDDGWDDTGTVWEFHNGFPNGFLPLKAAAEKVHAEAGIWLSPWGGYSHARDLRLKTGRKEGYEIDAQGYALSGPKYYKRFHDVTLDLVGKYGINQFKFDGTGSPDKQYPGSAFGSDFEAAISLIQDLRTAKPDLFINLTTGTWPSPFWTRYADSIWRGGADHSFAGVGSNRQRWMTYRDGDTYRGVVQRGPLYPLNSLMLHGIIYGKFADRLNTDPQNDFRDDVRAYFSTGTQLQELYITPSLLTKANWDDLAEAAKWARTNADALVDTHWIGGDPRKLEVYGHASWNPRKGILALRNPSDKPQSISVDVQQAFELPQGAPDKYVMHSPWVEDRKQPSVILEAGKSTIINLKPFELVVWNAKPER